VGLGALLSTAISASVGVGSLWLSGILPDSQVPAGRAIWWLGDPSGMLTVAPLLLLASTRAPVAASGAAIASLFVSVMVWLTLHGHGPFVEPWLAQSLLLTQTSTGAVMATSLALAALTVQGGSFSPRPQERLARLIAYGDSRSTEVVSSANASGSGSTPSPGSRGTARWPSSSTKGAVTSWWK
jgi:hypothetical protein